MKVLHIETGRHLYGGALQVRYLLEVLGAKGIKNILVCSRGAEIAPAAAPFAQVRQVPVAGDFDPRLLLHLRRAIRAEKPDIVHVHSRRGADLWGGIAARAEGVGALVTRRVDNPEPGWLARTKYGMYQKIVTISEGIRQVLLNEGLPGGKLVCIPSAVDFGSWQQICDRDWFQREFGFSPENRVIALIAQLIPRKGHRYLIEAVPAILAEFPQVRFLFLGQGPLRDRLRELCEAQGLIEKVIFAGFRRDLPRILPCLDLVVHPALMEGLGVSLLQAAAVGLPLVAARAGGIPEIVREGVNGYLVPPADAGALALRVIEILKDRNLSRRLGLAGKQLVKEKYSIEAMVGGYLEVYRNIAPGGRSEKREDFINHSLG